MWHTGTNWEFLASQMASHGPPLWGCGERNPPVVPLPALELRVPGHSTAAPQSPPGALSTLGLAPLLCFTELKKHQARGWCSWHSCLLLGLLRTLRAAEEIKSSQEEPWEALSQGGLWVDVCVGGFQDSLLP